VRIIGVCQDITERKLAEEQVRASQERFRMMVENVRDYAIYILDMNGYVKLEPRAERIEGYAPKIIGKHFSCFFFWPIRRAGDPGMQLQFASIQGRYEARAGACARTGRSSGPRDRHAACSTRPENRAVSPRSLTMSPNRKRAEEDLHRLRRPPENTSRRLVEVQEAERRLLARELHDRVGRISPRSG